MSDNVFVNSTRTEVVEEASPGKKYQMKRKEAVRLGLLPEGEPKPQARRNAREDTSRELNSTTPPEDTAIEFTTTSSPATRETVKPKAAKNK